MAIITLTSTHSVHPHLRKIDLRRDLRQVADLIQLSFADTLDFDGLRYLAHLRSLSASLATRVGVMADPMVRQMAGFVWEEEGKIIGNLSMYVVPNTGGKIWMIANVAVHPDHRRRGIARLLTEAALEEAAHHPGVQVWLHVRVDNPPALALYDRAGFVERGVRTTWRRDEPDLPVQQLDVDISPRRSSNWPLQEQWMNVLHPPEMRWYFSLPLDDLRPGVVGWLRRAFSEFQIKQWSGTYQNSLVGVVAWHSTYASADRLWLATSPEQEERAIRGLIPGVIGKLKSDKSLVLEYPAGRGEEAFRAIGFISQQTLAWMRYPPPGE